MNECECKFCGYTWSARTENPKACPNCKRYRWNEDIKKREPKKED